MRNFLTTIKDSIISTYMCLKYPFLYPRNRFTGLHYNNWKLHDYCVENTKKCTGLMCINSFSIKGKDNPVLHSVLQDENDAYYNCTTTWPTVNIFVNGKRVGKVNTLDYDHVYRYGFYKSNNSNRVNFGIISNFKKDDFRTIDYVTDKWLYMKVKFVKFFYEYILQFLHCIPTYTEWSVMERGLTGWNKAFGKKYLNELKKQLKKDHMLYKWRIIDIKEKYGSLRLYCNYGSRDLYEIIGKYEDLSYHTCIECGKPAVYLSSGWILPLCEDCFDTKKSKPSAVIGFKGQWIYKDET